MKKLIFLFVIVALFSCKETMPDVPDNPPPPTERKVLIEEFTGVECSGCPFGSEELELLSSQFGENLVIVSIHTSDFGTPYPNSLYDFRTSEAEEIADYLGRPGTYPSAVINRKDFDGGAYFLQLGKQEWVGYINQELEKDPQLTVNITKEYDSSIRELKVKVSGVANENIVGELRLTILIVENDIVDPQNKEGVGIIDDYNHKHVFRKTMTNPTGDQISASLSTGESYDVDYSMILSEDWKPENCEIIAFVNLIDGQSKEVLQADSEHVED